MAQSYRHILVAVELTDDGFKVADRANDIAIRCGARLSLLHVVEPLPIDATGEAILPPTIGLESELSQNAEQRLREFAEQLNNDQISRHVSVGYTKREILGFAEQHGVDLIVVGSHGRHGLSLLLGSTANAVLHGATCDVLAVRI